MLTEHLFMVFFCVKKKIKYNEVLKMPFGKKLNTAIKPVRVSKSYRVKTKAIDDNENMVSAVVSTESKDRDGEIILASAWSDKAIAEFMSHPVLISSHNYDDLTKQIGEWVELKATDNGLEGVAKYYTGMGNKEADWGYELAKQGKSAYSIGFIANDYIDGNGKDDAVRTYTDVELLEISQVTIPSNRDSLVTMRSKGLDLIADEIASELFDAVEKQVPTPPTYIQENAKRGLELQGFAGDGLTEATKRDAREMARGNISEPKVRKMSAWFQRHEGDLSSEKADDYLSGKSDRPTAGQVAWLLWGGTIQREGRMDAQKWAERIVNRLNEEEKQMNDTIKMPYPEEDMFATQEEAEARAEELGCEGSHEMEVDGETFFMPCNSHESYEETVKPSEDEENEEEDPQDDEYDEDKNTGCDCACKNDAKRGHTQATKVAKVYSPTDAVKTGIYEAINELLKN